MGKIHEYLNETLDIRKEYKEIFGHDPAFGKIFCPFHINKNSPAAKIYGNVIRCFSCNKSFTVYDLLYKYNPKKIELIKETVLMDVEAVVKGKKPNTLRRNNLDMSQGIESVIQQICQS